MNRAQKRAAARADAPIEDVPAVCFAFVHGTITSSFLASLIRCRDYEAVRTGTLFGVKERRANSGGIPDARNLLTAAFIDSPFEWLWMADSDMGFPREALQMMLAVADKDERPIIGGLCFAQQAISYDEETNAEAFGIIPTIYLWEYDEQDRIVGGKVLDNYPKDTVCKVDATGAAFLLIHRSVFEKMAEKAGPCWWSLIPQPDKPRTFGEDTSFMLRAYALDIPVHVHTGVRTSHDKGGIFLTETLFDATRVPADVA